MEVKAIIGFKIIIDVKIKKVIIKELIIIKYIFITVVNVFVLYNT